MPSVIRKLRAAGKVMAGIFGLLPALYGCGSDSTTAQVELQLVSSSFSVSASSLEFRLVDSASGGAEITDAQLNLEHEKKLHVYVFDASLIEFRHVHPDYDGSKWVLPLTLSVNGVYRIYVQGQLAQGTQAFTVDSQFVVTGGTSANPTPAQLTSSLIAVDEANFSRVTLTGSAFTAGATNMIPISFSRVGAGTPQLSLYLSEYIHAAFVPESGAPFLHVHGMLQNGAFHLMVNFPTAGMYRGWIQFKDAGTLRTVAVAVQAQ